jgi:hypothetical protein
MEYKNLGTKVDHHKKKDGLLNKLSKNGHSYIEERLGVKKNGYEPRYVKILGVGSEVKRIGLDIIKYFERLIN